MTIVGEATVSAILAAMPGTRIEIAARIGRNDSLVGRWLRQLHKARKVHILRWVGGKRGGPFRPVYARRNGKDAKAPAAMTEAQKSQRQRDKVKAPITMIQTRWASWHPWGKVQSITP